MRARANRKHFDVSLSEDEGFIRRVKEETNRPKTSQRLPLSFNIPLVLQLSRLRKVNPTRRNPRPSKVNPDRVFSAKNRNQFDSSRSDFRCKAWSFSRQKGLKLTPFKGCAEKYRFHRMFFFVMRTNSKVFLPEIDTNSKVFWLFSAQIQK